MVALMDLHLLLEGEEEREVLVLLQAVAEAQVAQEAQAVLQEHLCFMLEEVVVEQTSRALKELVVPGLVGMGVLTLLGLLQHLVLLIAVVVEVVASVQQRPPDQAVQA